MIRWGYSLVPPLQNITAQSHQFQRSNDHHILCISNVNRMLTLGSSFSRTPNLCNRRPLYYNRNNSNQGPSFIYPNDNRHLLPPHNHTITLFPSFQHKPFILRAYRVRNWAYFSKLKHLTDDSFCVSFEIRFIDSSFASTTILYWIFVSRTIVYQRNVSLGICFPRKKIYPWIIAYF